MLASPAPGLGVGLFVGPALISLAVPSLPALLAPGQDEAVRAASGAIMTYCLTGT